MPSKVITNDLDKRKDFKEQTMKKIAGILDGTVEEAVSISIVEVGVPSNFWELSDTQLYGILKYQKLTPEQATGVIDKLRGYKTGEEFKILLQPPIVEDITFTEAVPLVKVIPVELPYDFQNCSEAEKFLFLTRGRSFSPEQANDLIFILDGKPPINPYIEYSVSFSEKTVEDIFVGEKPTFKAINIVLPDGFTGLKRVYQEMMLTKLYGLSISETFDVLSFINGEPVDHRDIIVEFDEPVPKNVPEIEEYPELTVTLPSKFDSLRPQEQYLYLKTELRLTADQANDVISVFRGNSPIYSKIIVNFEE